ncbi:MAG: NAD(P)H-dependent oxidoreductase [Bacteroidota bacterium]
MNICIISGSARANNNTIRVAKALKQLHHAHPATIIDFQQYDIPLIVHGDVNAEALTPFQQQLCNAMIAADIIYIITPEYNWSTTPEILNWLHRFGERVFMPLFDNKVFALVGVSTGKGGKAPALHLTGILHKIISFMDLESIVSPKLFESHYTKDVLDENGNLLGNTAYEKGLVNFVEYTYKIAERWKKN